MTVTPWADDGPPVIPMSDVDELVAVLSQVLEGRAAPIDIERALDAVARTGPSRPGDFNRRIGPLTRLARRHRFPAGFPAPSIAWMVSVWLHLGGAYAPGPREIAPDHGEPLPYQWLSGRIHEVAAGSRDADSQPLLALPAPRAARSAQPSSSSAPRPPIRASPARWTPRSRWPGWRP